MIAEQIMAALDGVTRALEYLNLGRLAHRFFSHGYDTLQDLFCLEPEDLNMLITDGQDRINFMKAMREGTRWTIRSAIIIVLLYFCLNNSDILYLSLPFSQLSRQLLKVPASWTRPRTLPLSTRFSFKFTCFCCGLPPRIHSRTLYTCESFQFRRRTAGCGNINLMKIEILPGSSWQFLTVFLPAVSGIGPLVKSPLRFLRGWQCNDYSYTLVL